MQFRTINAVKSSSKGKEIEEIANSETVKVESVQFPEKKLHTPYLFIKKAKEIVKISCIFLHLGIILLPLPRKN